MPPWSRWSGVKYWSTNVTRNQVSPCRQGVHGLGSSSSEDGKPFHRKKEDNLRQLFPARCVRVGQSCYRSTEPDRQPRI